MFEICIEGYGIEWLVIEINEAKILKNEVATCIRGRGGKGFKSQVIVINNINGSQLEALCTLLKPYEEHHGINIEISF